MGIGPLRGRLPGKKGLQPTPPWGPDALELQKQSSKAKSFATPTATSKSIRPVLSQSVKSRNATNQKKWPLESDAVALLLYCPTHKRMALENLNSRFWFPCTLIKSGNSHEEAFLEQLMPTLPKHLLPLPHRQIAHLRYYRTAQSQFITVALFYQELGRECWCTEPSSGQPFYWKQLHKIRDLQLVGQEPRDYAARILNKQPLVFEIREDALMSGSTPETATTTKDYCLASHHLKTSSNCTRLPQLVPMTPNFGLKSSTEATFYRNILTQIQAATNIFTQEMYNSIARLCTAVKARFAAEPRILRLKTPCYIFGDLYGSQQDLIRLEQSFWPLGPEVMASGSMNYLFLGNYGDKANIQPRVVLYLFCIKMLAPERLHLLRGNHEVSLVNRCTLIRPGQAQYEYVIWKQLNDVFTTMPMASVVGGKVFAVHGGISGPIQKLYALEAVLQNPKLMSPLNKLIDARNQIQGQELDLLEVSVPWQLLWNDPLPIKQFMAIDRTLLKNCPRGFAPNTARKTAYYFNEVACSQFLALNGFTHLIRGHEFSFPGFRVDFGRTCLTVFSVSYYGQQRSRSAAVLVKECGDIQLIQFTNEDRVDDYGYF